MQAKEIMSKDVIVVYEADTIEDVAKLLVEKKISGVPVVDSERKLIGILSEADLVFQQKKLSAPMFFTLFDGIIQLGKSAYFDEIKKLSAYQVADLMTKEKLIFAYPETDISDLASLMIKNKINRIPIIGPNGEVVGIVSRYDIVKATYASK